MAWNAREKTAFNRGWSAGCGVQRRVCGLGLCRPTRRVTSWLNRDVNPCPACLPGLLWESKETPRVKGAFQATVLHKCKLLWFSLVVFGKLVSFYISRVSSTPPPTVRSKVFAFLLRARKLWSDKKKWSHQACCGPSLRLGHRRNPLPARPGSPALVTHTEGKLDRAQQSPLSEFHYAGLQTSRGEKCKGAGQRLKCERGSSLWSVWEWKET